ncbi:MAG TPA: DoxX family protein [bacterium]|nr:DoxX family protein [bacterium]
MRGRSAQAWLWQAFRLAVGFLFVLAAAGKLRDPVKFMGGMDQYGLVHGPILPLGAAAIPGIELVAGLCLLLGWRTRAAAGVISGLLLMFIAAMAAAMSKHLELDCSCFDLMGSDPNAFPIPAFCDHLLTWLFQLFGGAAAGLDLGLLKMNAVLAALAVALHSLTTEPSTVPRPWIWRSTLAKALALWTAFVLLRACEPAPWAVEWLKLLLLLSGLAWLVLDLFRHGWGTLRWGVLLGNALILGPLFWLALYKLSDGPSLLGWGTILRDVAMLLPALWLVFYGPAGEA